MDIDLPDHPSRRHALKCLAFGGAGTLFTLAGGVLAPIDLALAATQPDTAGVPLFLQISDTHIGFGQAANKNVAGTLQQTIALVNAMPVKPALTIHTGDITHLAKPEQFDQAAQLLKGLNITELHTVPGEHDVSDAGGVEYFTRFGSASNSRGYYSFDHQGVHFVALINVMNFTPNGLGGLGQEQLDWLKADLQDRSSSMPIVVFAHMPMWTIYAPWGWGTGDADVAMGYLRRFGSVTVLNGHIHQIVSKVEGNITFHTARSTAFPQPTAGNGPGPVPLTVPGDQLASMLGVTTVRITQHPLAASLADTTLA
ncbi:MULTISPECIES: metallophosphoesterase [unclassified Achromobacter]|uniref:metallophosphoesterase family protein n=1 Tax=unclassified Achromobacter TaxID=2626865 RepID=UPI000B51DAA6|nr:MULTISPECIES: metallophosphoesterase [unclassified Achromobacter]OWT77292.1 metallophosphoesterase [Achromobacter sp. HZ28]OWT78173.1 metallophosphoesterase [Achromobacter sp. HZ34]